MTGLAERIIQRKTFQLNPRRAAHLIHLFAGSEADPTDKRAQFVTSDSVTRVLIEISRKLPFTIFSILFMGCSCPKQKPESVAQRNQRFNNEHRKAAQGQADIFVEEGIWSEEQRERELAAWDKRHGY